MHGDPDLVMLLQLQAYASEIWWRAALQVPAAMTRITPAPSAPTQIHAQHAAKAYNLGEKLSEGRRRNSIVSSPSGLTRRGSRLFILGQAGTRGQTRQFSRQHPCRQR
ncbi:hypothetical protein Mnod_7337 [Methylobacterium nodulans ORS 2060]|uniref:Uncharacterized protein n=1 Tax=Methylobacterium nodulans (strain LMG 21967 / CNCM I-2342 / ORS 2060) TaxID=460265 RepID=B8ILV1_METNO|nr:hypothetical protein Mnod_7337 [Methylobacterium nodulans ORS 2060]